MVIYLRNLRIIIFLSVILEKLKLVTVAKAWKIITYYKNFLVLTETEKQ